MTEKTVDDLRLDVLRLELETKQFQLDQLRSAAEAPPPTKGKHDAGADAQERAAARDAALAARLTAVSTELGKVTAPALTVPDGVFRQREVTAAALSGAASRSADAIAAVAVAAPVLVTSRTDQARSVLAARAFVATVDGLQAEARALLEHGGGSPELRTLADAEEPAAEGDEGDGVPTDPIAAAAALGVATLGLLSVETTVTASSGSATELETHVPVLRHLLARQVPVLHESLGIPGPDNRVIAGTAALAPLAAALEALAAAAEDAISRLGKDPEPKQLRPLVTAKARGAALGARIVAFLAAAGSPDPMTGTSPLVSAAAAEQLGSGEAAFLAIVLPARTDAHQVSLKRRLFAPRLVVSASATIDVVVIELATGRTATAASCTDARSFQVRFPMWYRPWGAGAAFRSRPQLTPLPAPPLFEEPAAMEIAGALRPPVSQAPEADMNPPLA